MKETCKTYEEKSLNDKGYIRSLDFKEVTKVRRHNRVIWDHYLEEAGPSSVSLSGQISYLATTDCFLDYTVELRQRGSLISPSIREIE